METDEKILVTIGIVILVWVLVILSSFIFMPHNFEGYYLNNGKIWASYAWSPDEVAYYYTPEMWQNIVENNLHIEPSK